MSITETEREAWKLAAHWRNKAEALTSAAHGLQQELEAVKARFSWQPIETAPKDGTYVLVRNEHGTWVAHYVAQYQSGFVPDQKWHSMLLNCRHMPRFCSLVPTHWQPLPDSTVVDAS